MKKLAHLSLLLSLLAAAGCGDAPKATQPPVANAANTANAAAAKFVLAADPGAALGVVDAKLAGPAAKVVVEGRIANLVKGFAVLTLMDKALPYCGETNPEDHCKTPWDYCCEKAAARTANGMVVELHGADGKPLAAPAIGDLRLLDAIKVTGTLRKDADGNFVLVATGLFRSQRPELPNDLKWPQ